MMSPLQEAENILLNYLDEEKKKANIIKDKIREEIQRYDNKGLKDMMVIAYYEDKDAEISWVKMSKSELKGFLRKLSAKM